MNAAAWRLTLAAAALMALSLGGRNGRRALQMINRFPVKEELPGVIDDSLNPATLRASLLDA